MTSFDSWTITVPGDVESFEIETRLKHLDAPSPLYWRGDGDQGRSNRAFFLAAARERAGREPFEIWAAVDIIVGTGPDGESAFRVSGLECWMTALTATEEAQAALETLEKQPALPF